MKKYNFNDDFENIYLRHEFLKKIKEVNVKDIKKFNGIINATAYLMHNKYKFNFDKVGFDVDDIVSISKIYAIGYLNSYSLNNNPIQMDKFVNKYKNLYNKIPSQSQIEATERNQLINFLRQKLHHCSVVCNRKAKNIIVDKDIHIIVAKTDKSIPVCDNIIATNYKKFGYRKVTRKEFEKAKLRAIQNKTQDLTDDKGFKIIEIDIKSKMITSDEYQRIINKTDIYNNNPEEYFINAENNKELTYYKQKFNNLEYNQKRGILLRFIKDNRNTPRLKKEVYTARQMLKKIKEII
jgi:hypothetical protein